MGHVAFRVGEHSFDEEQLALLDAHLKFLLNIAVKAIAHWVEETFGVSTPRLK